MQAGKELWEHVRLLTKTDKLSLEGGLAAWHSKWEGFLNERKTDADGKNRYAHKKGSEVLTEEPENESALAIYLGTIIQTDMQIPDTTNAIDGHFGDLKNKFKNHNGLSVTRKKKFIDGFLKP